jgi:hypothetical protein
MQFGGDGGCGILGGKTVCRSESARTARVDVLVGFERRLRVWYRTDWVWSCVV